MFRTLALPSLHVLGVAFAMRLPRDRSHASKKTEDNHGLLSGVADVDVSSYYSRKLNLTAVSDFLSDKEYIYKRAIEDVGGDESKFDEYLSDINVKRENFMKKKIVWNREKFKAILNDIVESESGGTFACLLGGRSTGKSLVLHDIEKNHLDKIFIVNLRENPNILLGLVDVLKQRKDPKYDKFIKLFIKTLTWTFLKAAADKAGVKSALEASMKDWDDANEVIPTLQQLILKLLETVPGVITIVIDEANIAFTLSSTADEQKRKEALEALALFTTLTKESERMNVILVSSEHSFPFRLSEDVDFNIAILNRFIFAGEVPPKDMYTLLTTQWGVKHNLAVALIDNYGGHIYDVKLALERLKAEKSDFISMYPEMKRNVNQCLDCKDVDEQSIIDTLKRLAIDGFVPLKKPDDPIARIISKYNVGGVVQDISVPIGVRKDMWGDNEYGLVPSKQSMRLAIAKILVRENKLTDSKK